MGRSVLKLAVADRRFNIVAALESLNSEFLGMDAGTVAGIGPIGIEIGTEAENFDIIIDFSSPGGTKSALDMALKNKSALVTGTTALPQNVIDDLKSASAEIGIFSASNFSVGIALCGDLASQAAKSLPSADIEIIEAHHKNKADAPSGTALELAKKIAESRNLNFEKDIVYCRDGKDCSRKPNEIGISAVRGGGIIGEHRILLALPYETLIIEHRAISRDVFAGGALDAAEFVAGKTGYFGINDLLRK